MLKSLQVMSQVCKANMLRAYSFKVSKRQGERRETWVCAGYSIRQHCDNFKRRMQGGFIRSMMSCSKQGDVRGLSTTSNTNPACEWDHFSLITNTPY